MQLLDFSINKTNLRAGLATINNPVMLTVKDVAFFSDVVNFVHLCYLGNGL